jgi:hypothetical protein
MLQALIREGIGLRDRNSFETFFGYFFDDITRCNPTYYVFWRKS